MENSYLSSYLSKQVRRMLVEIGETYVKNRCCTCEFINSCLTLKWKKIETILCISDDFSFHKLETSWFIDKIEQLWPIFVEAHSLLKHSFPAPVNIASLCEWTSHPEEIKHYLNLFLSDDASTSETILFLTAVLERSLGNLFLLNGKIVPSLLRDLLSTPEIEIVLGKIPVVFLQIFVGTPLALNLRNIAWHGFPRQDELYPHYVSVLFVVILSVGELLKQRTVDLLILPKRPQIQYSVDTFDNNFPRIQKYHEEVLVILSCSDFIPMGHYPHWKQALELFKFGKYGRSLLLLLPQIEHRLRCLFCCVNNCSNRILTAESVSLYTTLNEIMAENIVSEEGVLKKNELIGFLGESVIEMLQDLFFHPNGPRLRDKMSHGECNIGDIPEIIVNNLICIALVIEVKSNERFANNSEERENETTTELKKHLVSIYKCYESKFHQSFLLKTKICDCVTSVNNLSSLCDKIDAHNDMKVPKVAKEESELNSMIKQVYSMPVFSSLLCNDDLYTYVVGLKIRTIFCPKSENELVNLLRQTMDSVQQISEQAMRSLEEKYSFYSHHLLRSRQRETFLRMVHLLPKLKEVLFCVICFAVICLKMINNIHNLSTKELGNFMKFCRAVLQFVQNVTSLTRSDKNRWLETEILCEQFCQKFLEYMNSCVVFKDNLIKSAEIT